MFSIAKRGNGLGVERLCENGYELIFSSTEKAERYLNRRGIKREEIKKLGIVIIKEENDDNT